MDLKEKISENYNLVTVLGPTAAGKTSFAVQLAYMLDCEIISCDSRQVYRGMDIGTGKDLADYKINGKQIKYNLIDIVDAGIMYNLFEYQKDFFNVFEELTGKGKIPVLCGGTGLYIEAIINNYNLLKVPENKELRNDLDKKDIQELIQILSSLKTLHNTTEIDTKKRAIRAIEIETYYKDNPNESTDYYDIKSLNIGVKFDRQSQRKRITKRLKDRLDNGMIEEVRRLIDSGVPVDTLIYYGLEYKYLTYYILGQMTYNEMFEKLNTAIHQFAKRQMTWFRRMERKGIKIYWLDGYMSMEQKLERLMEIVKN